MTYTIAALYRFTPLADPAALRDELRAAFTAPAPEPEEDAPEDTALCGTLILAPEGLNGTLAGSAATIHRLLTHLTAATGLDPADVKFSTTGTRPFGRLKLHLKPEIIPFRKATVDPIADATGHYVAPRDWNTLIADPTVLLLDTRNHYETSLGTFAGAITPPIHTFSDFATWAREHLDPTRHTKVAMFCTGGIRCEKASAFLLQQGFPEVFHLKGGILKYLEVVPAADTRWQGTCFVFDRRTSVDHTDFQP
jgi:UPF0176 protein